jgi:AAA+ ATPase superfamily predicted ATPase
MQIITGPPVRNDNFFGRESDIGTLTNMLNKGNSIYLLGERRMGKTSLLYKLVELYKDQFNFTFFTLFDPRNESLELSFIFSKMFPDYPNPNSDLNYLEPKSFVDAIKKNINNENPIVLIFDEFPYYIESYSLRGADMVEKLLSYHRQIRQLSNSKILFIYSGESSLTRYPLLHKYLNDLTVYVLQPLSKTDSMVLIDNLSSELIFKNKQKAKNRIYQFTQGTPFNIQLFFYFLNQHLIKNEVVADEILDKVIEKSIYEKQYRYFQPPQNDSFKVKIKVEDTIDLTNN